MDCSEVTIDDSKLWHPSLKLNVDRRCAAFPGGLLFDGMSPIQTVCLNNHLYVGAGVFSGTEHDKCRLYEYSLTLNTWDIFDTHLAEFALASYRSRLILLGGRECEFGQSSFCTPKTKSLTNKIWFLDDQYQFQEADIPPMNKPRKSALATSHEDHLIVVGGDVGESKTIEIYDDQTKKWLFAPTLPKGSQLQSIVMHTDGILYIQLTHHMSSKVLWATLKSLNDSCTADVRENNDLKIWKEIVTLDRVFSNLMLCQDNLFLLGGSHGDEKKYVFICQPSDPTQRWINIADVPVDLSEYYAGIARIVSLSDDQFLLFGYCGTWTEVMFLIKFHVSAVELNCLFALRDLEKLESGANIPVYSKLQPFAFDLKTKIGLGNLSEEQTFVYRALHGNTDSIHTFIIRWIKSRNPKIECTWMNLIQLLEEFGEKMFANQLKHYLTFPPECVVVKETSMEELTTKKLESVKVEIEQLCGYELLNVDVHQQLQECVKLCDSAKKMLTEEHQELKAKHEELLKEKEELTTQLELLKQTN